VYSSLPDGSDLMLAAAFPLTYERGELREPQVYVIPAFRLEWLPWVDGYRSLNPGWTLAAWPMPMLSDIEFTHDGDMVIGLRDRQIDVVIPIGGPVGGTASALATSCLDVGMVLDGT